jgi:iron complex transport system substrate-binding protein
MGEVTVANIDLILAVNSRPNQQEYDTLSRMVPTVAQCGENPDFGTSWQEQTRIIGTALVLADRVEQLIDQVEARFAAARDANSDFDGATGVIALIGEDGTYHPHGAQAQIDGLRSNSVYQAQPVVAQRRDVFLPPNGALGAALVYNNVLSLPFAIEGMMPLLQAAVDGDPNTAVSAA